MNIILGDLLIGIRDGKDFGRGWLFLPKSRDWTARTSGLVLETDDIDPAELDPNGEPKIVVESGLVEALDIDTINGIVEVARRLQNPPSIEVLLEAFIYYFKHDAYLPRINAPAPPPWEEVLLKMDREFYGILGEERSNTKCKRPGCTRGAITLSVFCRKHHFENVKGRPCPFD